MLNATLNRQDILTALDSLVRVAPRRGTVPIVAGVLIETRGDAVRLSCCDFDLVLSVDVPAYPVTSAGALVVNCATLADLVKKTPKGSQVEFRTVDDGARLEVIAGRTRSKVQTLSTARDAFPSLKPVDYAGAFTHGAIDLARMLSSVAPAFSVDPCRCYLHGAFLHCDAGRLAVAATDGHLLLVDVRDNAGAVAAISAIDAKEPGLLIPAPVVDLLARLVKSGLACGTATVSVSESRLLIAAGAVTLDAKAIDGTFPDYRRVIPTVARVGTWTVDGAAALAFYASQPATTGRGNQPGVAAAFWHAQPIETRTASGTGFAWSTAPGTYTGQALTRGLQPRIAKAAFQFFADAGAVAVELFENPESPLAMKAEHKPGAFALAMPVRCEFEPAPAVADLVAPYEAAFPGMARDLSTVENGCQSPGGTGPRVATPREIGAYLADLLERAGFNRDAKPVDPVASLGRAVTYGAKLTRIADAPADEPQQFSEGSFSLLIPGGLRTGERVTLETLDESGRSIKAQPLTMADGKMTARAGGLSISPADVAAIVGPFEPVGLPMRRKGRKAAPVAIVAPVAPVDAPSVELEPVRVEIPGSDAVLINWQAVDAMASPAPVDVDPVEPVDLVRPVTVDAPAPDLVASDAGDFAARLARIEAALGLVAPAKRSPSHAAAIRRAWSARNAARAARKDAGDWQAIAEQGAAHVDRARAERDAATARAIASDKAARDAVERAAVAVDKAERALRERDAARLESGERVDLVAAVDEARKAARHYSAQADALGARLRSTLCAKRQLVRRGARLRADIKAARSQADGLAVNLQALTRRTVADGERIASLSARVANLTGSDLVDQPRPSFIMTSR